MSVENLWNSIKRHIDYMLSVLPHPRRGTVTSVDPTQMRAKVLIQPEGQLTGWLPIVSPLAAAGWGILAAPPPGAQALVIPTDGYADAAVVPGSHWSTAAQPPGGYVVGEIWLYHQTGALIRLRNAGSFECIDQKGAIVTADGTGLIRLQDASGTEMTFDNNGKTATLDGTLIVTKDVVVAGIGFIEHGHNQPVDSHGDTEYTTTLPIVNVTTPPVT